MKLKLKRLKLGAGRPIAFIHEGAARKLNLHLGDRVEISHGRKKIIALVDLVRERIKPNEAYLSEEITSFLKIEPGDTIEVTLALAPISARYIAKKLSGIPLTKKEITTIIKDIVSNALTEGEVAYFVSATYEHGMSLKEIIYLTESMYKTGKSITWQKGMKIVDKHSIGGIAGNRTTPIIVSICAAAGIVMPKTSSRAITSASGTADVVETLAKVDLSIPELKKVVRRTGACLVWGGSLGMAPADDKLIRVERLLSLDPESQLIASIMSKKLAVGSKYVLIDIPYGPQAKVSKKRANRLRKSFLDVGKHFNLRMRAILTDGSQPIGNGIGPILEIKDVLRVLERNDPPKILEKKSIMVAAEILEMTGKSKKGQGKSLAKKLLDSGEALNKFNEILDAQGRKKGGLKTAKFKHDLKAKTGGKIKSINNRLTNYLGRILGCPLDKAAGIYIHHHKGEKIKKGETLLTLYSETKNKLREAINFFKKTKIISFH